MRVGSKTWITRSWLMRWWRAVPLKISRIRGEASVAGGVSGDDVLVDVPGDAMVGAGELAVAGVGPGPSALVDGPSLPKASCGP